MRSWMNRYLEPRLSLDDSIGPTKRGQPDERNESTRVQRETLENSLLTMETELRKRFLSRRIIVPFISICITSVFIQTDVTTIWAFKPTYKATSLLNSNVHTSGKRVQPLFVPHVTLTDSSSSSDSIGQVNQGDVDGESASTIVGTIQILMSDTGGGHRASAIALQDAFNTLYSSSTTQTRIQCDIVDIYTEYGPVWPYNDYVSIYKYMAAHPWMWKLLYEFGQSDFGLWFNQFMLELFCTEAFTKCINRVPPPTNDNDDNNNNDPPSHRQGRADMILSVHPLTQDLPLKILSTLDQNGSGQRTTPFVTVVTDLGSAHPTWFNPGVDKCFVPSDALYQAALQRQLQPHQIVQYGLPIRKGFWSQPVSSSSDSDLISSDGSNQDNESKKERQHRLRRTLGLDETIPIVLVVGGGDGMGGIIDISKELGYELSRTSNLKSQMVVICGKNQYAKEQLEQVSDWGTNVIVHIKGFVNNMDEYMKASDVLVTKAGPGTIAEASICGLPCMMFSYLPGQEEGNIPYVVDAGFGTYSSDPNVIGNTVREWLLHPEVLQQLQQAAVTASRPNATLDIARDIGEMLFEHLKKIKK